ncbi:MAG TPA: iron-sulfur cluster repair di-iron protein, partial [Chitinophagaceae bacterium]|nr:iron-sulfur cluster repair di-iron protein [Chitinophagaceae bacterium]
RQKHRTVFNRFDELAEGESLTIHNDHDPKPLYYQMLAERGNIFIWDYKERGPQWWKVKITKRVSGENDETLGQIAAKDLRKVEIFRKYGLDFCCGGKKTVKEACRDNGLDEMKIEQELQQLDRISSPHPIPYNDWSLDFLSDYIVNSHHSYVKKNLPDIRAYAEKVMQVHGNRHAELLPIYHLVEEVYSEMMNHMVKEERVLFPYIKELVVAKSNSQPLQAAHFETVQNPINMMEMEHEAVGENLAQIRELSNNYSLPEDACASYSLLYQMLNEFEEDLQLHVHLENNILFPKALKLEKDHVKNN